MDFVGRIYEAIEDEDAYLALPELLSDAVGARSCTLQLLDPDYRVEDIQVNHFSREMLEFYVDHNFQHFDDWVLAIDRDADWGKALLFSDRLRADEFCNGFFYNEFIRHFGDDSVHCLGFADTRSDGGTMLVGLHRPRDAADFGEENRDRLEALRPHLTRMIVLRNKLRGWQESAGSARLGINSVEDAFIIVREDRQLQFANISAEALLREGQLLRMKDARLEMVRPVDQRRLLRALLDASANRIDGHTAFTARDARNAQWRFSIVPKRFNGVTALLIWIDSGSAGTSAAEALQELYNLTAAEVPVLMALSEGLSAFQIADRLGVSIATVRTHVQHIYNKTGVHKVSQLATLVASLPKLRRDPE
ncbi:response regulator transcription factor [Aurantiacibacter hainanensis]|uniref:response regulator transcription factor n=1 Tax=Aurantiacibacter hainanensis TaxID=3076114 RepID=UPI0030C73BC5